MSGSFWLAATLMVDALDTLTDTFARLDEDGNRVFPVQDVRHALPLLVLCSNLDPAALSTGMQELMAETMEAAGITAQLGSEEALAAFQEYYDENPVSDAVLREIRNAFDVPHAGPSKAAKALLGTPDAVGVFGGGVRPSGSITGAMGQLAGLSFAKRRTHSR